MSPEQYNALSERHRDHLDAAVREVASEPWATCMLSLRSPSLRRLGAMLVFAGAQEAIYFARYKQKLAKMQAHRRAKKAAGNREMREATLGDVIAYATKLGFGHIVRTLLNEEKALRKRAEAEKNAADRHTARLYAQRLRTAALRFVLEAGMRRLLEKR
jgi:hypothetical protein